MDSFRIKFGYKIRECRQLRGWTQTYLAEQLKISQAAIHKIEKGNVTLSLDLAIKIASLLAISIDEFANELRSSKLSLQLDNFDSEIQRHVNKLINFYSEN